MQRLGYLDSFCPGLRGGTNAARARQAHPFVRQHRVYQRFKARVVGLRTRERFRVDCEDRVPDPWLVAGCEV